MTEPPSFETFTASELYCDRCRAARPVRKKLLLALPSGDLSVYVCTACGNEVGRQVDGEEDSGEDPGGADR